MGKGINNFWNGYIFNGIWIVAAIIGLLLQASFFGSYIIFTLLAIYLIISSTVRIVQNYYGGKICPNCNQESMLSLKDPQAVKLIKQFDLEAGVNSAPDTFKKPSTGSSSKAPES